MHISSVLSEADKQPTESNRWQPNINQCLLHSILNTVSILSFNNAGTFLLINTVIIRVSWRINMLTVYLDESVLRCCSKELSVVWEADMKDLVGVTMQDLTLDNWTSVIQTLVLSTPCTTKRWPRHWPVDGPVTIDQVSPKKLISCQPTPCRADLTQHTHALCWV